MLKRSKINYSSLAGWTSIVLNIFLFVLKYWAGIVSHSVALIADAWHTLSDSISSIIVLIGLKVARKPADKTHPYGHGRAEQIAAVIVGVILFFIGVNFLVESIEKLREHEPTSFGKIAIIATVCSIIIKEIMARYSIRIGKQEDFSSLVADGWHHRSDAFTSIIIFTGIFLGEYFCWVDGVLGILVSLFVFYSAYSITKDPVSSLLGKRIEYSLEQEIRDTIAEIVDREIYIHHFHLHRYGRYKEMTCHIILPRRMTLMEVHSIVSKIEQEIKAQFNIEATIHPEPDERDGHSNVLKHLD
jgi:cation diffusion facilitator family transporter